MLHGRKGGQAAGIDTGTRGHNKTPHPPTCTGPTSLSAPLKFAPYFCQNLSLCNSILQNRTFGLGNHEG